MTALPAVRAVMSRPSRIGTPEEINVPSVRVNRATAILRSSMPISGSFSKRASMTNAALSVSVPNFDADARRRQAATTNQKPKMLPTKLLMPITMRVGSGRSTPKPTNKVAKIGTTFQSSRVMTPPATKSTTDRIDHGRLAPRASA